MGIMNSLPAHRRGVGAGMAATFQNSAMVLSIGIFFSLMIVGLSASLPGAMDHGLVAQGVPAADATRIAHLPAVGVLFASFLGYNPMQHLLGPTLHQIPAHNAAYLTGPTFFPHLIAQPFANGLHVAFDFAIVACLIAAAASWLRGSHYVHERRREQPRAYGRSRRQSSLTSPGAVARVAALGDDPETLGPRGGAQRAAVVVGAREAHLGDAARRAAPRAARGAPTRARRAAAPSPARAGRRRGRRRAVALLQQLAARLPASSNAQMTPSSTHSLVRSARGMRAEQLLAARVERSPPSCSKRPRAPSIGASARTPSQAISNAQPSPLGTRLAARGQHRRVRSTGPAA